MIRPHVGYAEIRAVADAFAHELDATLEVKPTEHLGFLPGCVAALFGASGTRLGVMGEVHPEVLENHGLRHPASALELSLEKLLRR